MTTDTERKRSLHGTLQYVRDALVWKLDGLPERELRLPRTPTGTNLLGLVKHALNVEAGYFGQCLGRSFPTPSELVSEELFEADPNADFYATAEESAAQLVDLYRRVQAFADAAIDELPLDTRARVPWWKPGRDEPALEQLIKHVTIDLARHAGHADILREQIDGAVGLSAATSNVPDYDREAYLAKLTALARRSD